MSGEELTDATVMEDALVWWRQGLHGGTEGVCKHVSTPTLKSV